MRDFSLRHDIGIQPRLARRFNSGIVYLFYLNLENNYKYYGIVY